MKKFKSVLKYDDYRHILDRYLGEEKQGRNKKNGKECTARPRRFCDIPYDTVVEITTKIVELELVESGDEDFDAAADYWADVVADWVSESELEPVLT